MKCVPQARSCPVRASPSVERLRDRGDRGYARDWTIDGQRKRRAPAACLRRGLRLQHSPVSDQTTTHLVDNPRLVAPGGDPHGVSEPAGEQPGDGRAGDYRHGAGRAGADRRREPHHGRRRVALELHLPVGAGGRGRHVEPGGHHRRDRRHLHPDRRRRGQEDQGAGELHRRAERRGGAHQRGVSLVRHGHHRQHHRARAAQRHGDLDAAQDDGHLRRARAHRVLDDLRRAGDGDRRSDLRLRPRRRIDGDLLRGLGHRHAAVLPRRDGRVKRRPRTRTGFPGPRTRSRSTAAPSRGQTTRWRRS